MFSHLPVKMSPQVILVRWWMKTLGDGSVEKTPRITPLWAATMMGFIISGSAAEPRGPNSILHIYYIVSIGSDCLGVISLELRDGSLGQNTMQQVLLQNTRSKAWFHFRSAGSNQCSVLLRHFPVSLFLVAVALPFPSIYTADF